MCLQGEAVPGKLADSAHSLGLGSRDFWEAWQRRIGCLERTPEQGSRPAFWPLISCDGCGGGLPSTEALCMFPLLPDDLLGLALSAERAGDRFAVLSP